MCDGLGSTVVSLSKLVPSNPSFIQDLKKMAHTVESTQASIVPSGSGTDPAEEVLGRVREEVVCLLP